MDFVYISIPKTASQSVRQLLIDNGRIDLAKNNHESIYNYKGDIGFSFSFIREPIERLKSWFYFSKKQMMNSFNSNNIGTFSNMSVYNVTFVEWVRQGFLTHWSKDFCASLGIESPLSQCDFVCKEGIVDVDYLANFNNINNEMIKIGKMMSFDNSVLKSIGSNYKQEEFMDSSIISLIKEKFKNDFKLYDLIQKKVLTKGIKVF